MGRGFIFWEERKLCGCVSLFLSRETLALVKAFTDSPRTVSTGTLTAIAKQSGFSVSTVSYALRDDPKIPLATREKIRAVAERLGYHPHPSIAALMSHVRANRSPKAPPKIAFVWVEPPPPVDAESFFHRQAIEGARQRAEQRGYLLEEFQLSPQMTAQRLSQVLHARGILGVVFSGSEHSTRIRLDMHWDWHCAAIIGNARCTPELHRAGYYHFMGMQRIMAEMRARGYRRPVALLGEAVNERATRSQEAAFLAYHPAPSRARRALFKWPEAQLDFRASPPPRLLAWLRRERPDAVIVYSPAMIAPLKAFLRTQTDDAAVGFAVPSIEGDSRGASGIAPAHALIASSSVDLVIEQLLHNELGLPTNPKKILFEGSWVEGQTLPYR